MTTATQEAFLTTAPGQWFNPDNAYGYQCKDVADAYVMAIFPGVPWTETIRPGNGQDVFANANAAYFDKVANDPGNADQLPPRGAIVSIAGSAEIPEGHVAVVLLADQAGMWVVQQNGYTQTACEAAYLTYDGLIGWLVPKLGQAGTVQNRTVTQEPHAWIRTAPRTDAAAAPGFAEGIATGSVLAVVGYVAGQDPYDSGDNAWYVTVSGFYVWANAAENRLDGLPVL